VRPKTSAGGEIEIHADCCSGPLLATLPLMSAARGAGQTTLQAGISIPRGGAARDLCIFATGDPRDGQWALARLTLSK
jgi:hexosaminidase